MITKAHESVPMDYELRNRHGNTIKRNRRHIFKCANTKENDNKCTQSQYQLTPTPQTNIPFVTRYGMTSWPVRRYGSNSDNTRAEQTKKK